MKTKTNASFIAILFIAFGFAIMVQLSRSALILISYAYQFYLDQQAETPTLPVVQDAPGGHIDDNPFRVEATSTTVASEPVVLSTETVTTPKASQLTAPVLHHVKTLIELGHSQRQVAKMTGIPQTRISRALSA